MRILKNIFALALVLVVLVTGLPITQVSAASTTDANVKYDKTSKYYYKVTSKTKKSCAVAGYLGSFNNGGLVIPSKINGYSVTAIDEGAFASEKCKSVTIPSSVKKIGKAAFDQCKSLEKVVLNSGLVRIEEDAFRNCRFTSVDLPKTLEYIGRRAFCGTPIEQIEFPASLKEIDDLAFAYAEELKKIAFSEGLTRIGEEAFADASITRVTLPKSLKEIGRAAFNKCEQLTDVTIKSAEAIGEEAFAQTGITYIVLPDNLKAISDSMFSKSKLENIVIPDSVESIGKSAFSFSELASVDIPSSVTTIGDSAFCGCPLTSVVIPGSVKDFIFDIFYNNKKIQHIILEEGVETITWPRYALCDQLKTISIPDSVVSMSGSFSEFRDKVHCNSGTFAAKKFGGSKRHTFVPDVIEPTCVGGYTLYVCECGYSYKSDITEPVLEHDVVEIPFTPATMEADGCTAGSYCSMCNEVFVQSEIIYQIESIEINYSSFVYNGKVRKPTVCVKNTEGRTISGSDYSVTLPSSKEIGKYTCKVTLNGNYSGEKTFTYKIVPKATTLSKFNRYSGSLKVYWNSQKTNTSGYQLQYGKKKDLSDGKSIYISSNKTTEKTVKKLSNAKYYFRIRTYKNVKNNGKTTKYYSSWSPVSAVYATNKTSTKVLNHWEKCRDMEFDDFYSYQYADYNCVRVFAELTRLYRDYSVNKVVLYRATSKNGTYKKIKTLYNDDLYGEQTLRISYYDEDVKANKTYYYKVKVLYVPSGYGNSKSLDSLSAYQIIWDSISTVGTYRTALKPVRNKTTKSSSLSWKKVSGADGYIVSEHTFELEGYNVWGQPIYVSQDYEHKTSSAGCKSKLYSKMLKPGKSTITYNLDPYRKIGGYYYCDGEPVKKKLSVDGYELDKWVG